MATNDVTNNEMDARAEGHWSDPRDFGWLVTNYEPYVDRRVSIACGKNANLDRDEAKSGGMSGVWKASQKFNPSNGTKFTSFAQKYVDGGIIDAARDADEAPTKLRAQEKKGEIPPLPVKHRLEPSFDAPVRRGGIPEVTFDVAELLESCDGLKSLVDDITAALDHRWDFEEIGKAMGCSPVHAAITVKLSLERARDPDAYRRQLASMPPYLPPTSEARIQQVMFAV
jgi:hypothetical protein